MGKVAFCLSVVKAWLMGCEREREIEIEVEIEIDIEIEIERQIRIDRSIN